MRPLFQHIIEVTPLSFIFRTIDWGLQLLIKETALLMKYIGSVWFCLDAPRNLLFGNCRFHPSDLPLLEESCHQGFVYNAQWGTLKGGAIRLLWSLILNHSDHSLSFVNQAFMPFLWCCLHAAGIKKGQSLHLRIASVIVVLCRHWGWICTKGFCKIGCFLDYLRRVWHLNLPAFTLTSSRPAHSIHA